MEEGEEEEGEEEEEQNSNRIAFQNMEIVPKLGQYKGQKVQINKNTEIFDLKK